MDGLKILGKWYGCAVHMGTVEQEALMASSRGCRGAVTRVPWTIHYNLLNDGSIMCNC